MNNEFHPESLMMSFGYKPELSEGAIKCPIFQTSTYVFKTAEEGKAFFEVAYGLREKKEGEETGLIYSRLNTPNMEILENRLCLWDKAEDCAVFDSGMAAISTCLLEFLRPDDLLLYNQPLYGGTLHFITHILPQFGVKVMGFDSWEKPADIQQRIETQGLADSLTMIYLETPTNPTNQLTDISAFRSVADHFSTDEKKVILAVDNTYLGPLWQHPLEVGADLSLYSATKFIAGHSDLIAGACMGSAELIARMKTLRAFMGNMASAWTCWLMQRSLETLKLRMQKQADNAVKLAEFLASHPAVEKVYYLGFLKDNDPAAYAIFQKQCTSAGSMLAFDIVGGEKEAFQFINHLKLIKLAVSLGSTESLVEHPATMTHSGMEPAHKEQLSITSKLVRISVGVEHVDDLISDVCQALETVELPEDLVGAELVSCV